MNACDLYQLLIIIIIIIIIRYIKNRLKLLLIVKSFIQVKVRSHVDWFRPCYKRLKRCNKFLQKILSSKIWRDSYKYQDIDKGKQYTISIYFR